MDEIVELAQKLGKAIAASAASAKLRAARKALDAEPDLTRTFEEYRKQSEKVALLEAENKPVEVDDKHRLQDLHDKLISSETFKRYTAAQVDYVDMMRKVNEALQDNLGETEED